MARISTYIEDLQIAPEDKLVGSSYEGMVNGQPRFVTKNFTVEDLSEYFSQNITIGGTEYSVPEIAIKIENLQDMYTYDNILEDITGFSTAFIGFFNTTFDTRLGNKTTDDLTEGDNLYYTQDRFDTAFGLKTTDNLDEGLTNLYFTIERAQDAIGEILIEGDGIDITYDDANNTIEIGSTITQYTDALARGAIDVTDNGGYGELTYDNLTGVITYTGPSTEDIRGEFTAGNGITIADGEIAINTEIVVSDKHGSLSFDTSTFGSPVQTEVLNDGDTYAYFDFTHNLGKYPAITVVLTAVPDVVAYVPIKYIDNNTVRCYFTGATSGTVYAN